MPCLLPAIHHLRSHSQGARHLGDGHVPVKHSARLTTSTFQQCMIAVGCHAQIIACLRQMATLLYEEQ
jgi:hypothetical protein